MLFTLTHDLPQYCYVAVSGGPDSVAGLHFLSRKLGRVLGVLYYHHGTGEFADRSYDFVDRLSAKYNLRFITEELTESPPKGVSKEAFWREHRYNFFDKHSQIPIVTCHNLDDCVEQYIMNKLVRFNDKEIIPYYGPSHVVRPFRTWKKSSILEYCKSNNLEYLVDPTNLGSDNMRAHVRNNIVPQVLAINPGLYGQVRKLLEVQPLVAQ